LIHIDATPAPVLKMMRLLATPQLEKHTKSVYKSVLRKQTLNFEMQVDQFSDRGKNKFKKCQQCNILFLNFYGK
jgi:hypothetical protein